MNCVSYQTLCMSAMATVSTYLDLESGYAPLGRNDPVRLANHRRGRWTVQLPKGVSTYETAI